MLFFRVCLGLYLLLPFLLSPLAMASSDWIDEFVQKLTILDYFKLMTRVKDRFTARPLRGAPRRPWSQNSGQKKLRG